MPFRMLMTLLAAILIAVAPVRVTVPGLAGNAVHPIIEANSLHADTAATAQAPKAPVATQRLPRLVDVGADQCIPCKMMAPILEEMKKEYKGVLEVVFVDAWKNPEAAAKYRVRGIPTQIFYDASGKELSRHLGFISKEGILNEFEQVGVRIKKPAG